MTTGRRVVVIGLDGVSSDLVEVMVSHGRMPHLGGLMRRRAAVGLAPVLPSVSSVTWPCFTTGRNPGAFGVFGFSELSPSFDLRVPGSGDLRCAPIWDMLAAQGRRVAALGMPLSTPVTPLAGGVRVACSVARELGPSDVEPAGMYGLLASAGYAVDIDPAASGGDARRLARDLRLALEGRRKVLRTLLRQEWDVIALHVPEMGRALQYLLRAWGSGDKKIAPELESLFKQADGLVGEALDAPGAGRQGLMVLSDRGTLALQREVQLNAWLEQEGFLRMLPEAPETGFRAIHPQSLAFAQASGRIHVLHGAVWPRGAVSDGEYDPLRRELAARLGELRDPETKELLVRRVWMREELYWGEAASAGPDLVAEPVDGVELKAGVGAGELFSKSPISGASTGRGGFLWISDGVTTGGEGGRMPTLMDAAGVVFEMAGCEVPPELEAGGLRVGG